MTQNKLNRTNYEDIEDWVAEIERIYHIKFGEEEFLSMKNMGEVCDHIASKLPIERSGSCTTQHVFYQIRHALNSVCVIKPETLLTDVLPRRDRILKVMHLEKTLGFRLNILRPQRVISNALGVVCFVSVVGIFRNGTLFLPILLITILAFLIAERFGRELSLKTVSDLVRDITIDNYILNGDNRLAISKKELANLLLVMLNKNYSPGCKLGRATKMT